MQTSWIYAIISVILVSLISLIGIFTLTKKEWKLNKFLIYMVSFSAGGLLGDAFIHLIPESTKDNLILNSSLFVLMGIIVFFIVEKIIRWKHCHSIKKYHPFSYMIIIGDAVHNFIDGLIIASSYLVNIQVGIATTLAVIFHEIPQEIGDFSTLLYGGFKRNKALLVNFLSAITSIIGALIILVIGNYTDSANLFLIPFAAGGFIYIASSDLIPELHRTVGIKESFIQLMFFIIGILVMLSLLLIG